MDAESSEQMDLLLLADVGTGGGAEAAELRPYGLLLVFLRGRSHIFRELKALALAQARR